VIQYGQGKMFVGADIAGDDGTFTVQLQGVEVGDYLTATATDLNGNTSEFNRATLVPSPTNSHGIVISPNELLLSVGQTPVTYTIMLKSKPSAAVTVTIVADEPIVVSPQELVFSVDNWDVPQVVTVSLAASDLIAVAQASTVRHSITSADGTYNNMDAPNLVVNILQTGTPGVFLPMITR
jgi:hypothetical protein